MSVSEEDFKKFEDKYKSFLYEKIEELISKQLKAIERINKAREIIDIETDIPNTGITFNNKINELAKIFEKAGVSMFADSNEKYPLVYSNLVGDAIINDMISKLLKGTQKLLQYESSFAEITNKKMEENKALEKFGPIKKLFLKIRSFIVPNTVSELKLYSEEEVEEINSYLLEYKEVDEEVFNYNLRDNIVQSLVNLINNRGFSDVPAILEESVIPSLQKLGLEDLIPELQEKVSGSQEQTPKRRWEISPAQKPEPKPTSGFKVEDEHTK